MDASLFIAKLFGFYLLIFVGAMLIRPIHMRKLIGNIIESPAVMAYGSMMAIVMGLILVLFHNVWVLDWRLLVTILCWWILFKGCLNLFYPQALAKISNCVLTDTKCYYILIAIDTILGLFLLYRGFGR